MSTQAIARFEVKSWDEVAYSKVGGGPRLTRASITKAFQGDIAGKGTLEYLMIHHDDGSASFVGMEQVTGRLGNRSGSFVLQHNGTFDGDTARATCVVVPGSATGDLVGLQGEGSFEAKSRLASITLRYDLE